MSAPELTPLTPEERAAETQDRRVHVPIGGDVELYSQMSDWAPAIAGFVRFDFKPSTPGLQGKPGIPIAELPAGAALLTAIYVVLEAWDGNRPQLYVGTARHPPA